MPIKGYYEKEARPTCDHRQRHSDRHALARTAAIRDRFLDVEARRCDSPRSHTPPGRAGAPGEEVTNMHDEDLKLIRQIVASDGRKYTAGNIDRSRYDRLVDLGWLTPFKTNISDVEYQATEKGRTAAVADDQTDPPPCRDRAEGEGEVTRDMIDTRSNRWTPTEDDVFRKMAEANIRPELIAEELNRSVHAIKTRAYAIGLPLKWFRPKAKEMKAKGK